MSNRPPRSESELVEHLRSIDVRAPDELHHRIGMLVDERSAQASRRPLGAWPFAGRPSLKLAGAGAILAAVLVLALGLPGSGSTTINVREVSALTLRPATMAAPAQNPRRWAQLVEAVDGVAFPDWEKSFGWRSTGARMDHMDGRSVITVFYANGRGQRIGYAIVAGAPAPGMSGGVVAWRGGTPYRLFDERGMSVVAWLRDGRLCVVAGRGVSGAALLALASWNYS